jgi:hypothetical protein
MIQRLKSRLMPIDLLIWLTESAMEVGRREGSGTEKIESPDGK